jgi:hypothetical protein
MDVIAKAQLLIGRSLHRLSFSFMWRKVAWCLDALDPNGSSGVGFDHFEHDSLLNECRVP